jgi:aminoglycoside phosphotransferase (APT) family kinase protein
MLDYWEASLLDAVERRDAAIQVRAIDWLRAKMPAGADDDPRPCMGDARMANLIEREGEVVALIDWELAYIGNPQGDVGYHLYLDSRYGTLAGGRLDGLPSPDETWRRWEQRSGIAVADPRYWTAYGALVIAITATRALRLVHNLAAADVERRNPFVADLHRLIAVSARHAQPNAGARSKNGSNA